jgi:hypothetical protein
MTAMAGVQREETLVLGQQLVRLRQGHLLLLSVREGLI